MKFFAGCLIAFSCSTAFAEMNQDFDHHALVFNSDSAPIKNEFITRGIGAISGTDGSFGVVYELPLFRRFIAVLGLNYTSDREISAPTDILGSHKVDEKHAVQLNLMTDYPYFISKSTNWALTAGFGFALRRTQIETSKQNITCRESVVGPFGRSCDFSDSTVATEASPYWTALGIARLGLRYRYSGNTEMGFFFEPKLKRWRLTDSAKTPDGRSFEPSYSKTDLPISLAFTYRY